MDTIIETPVDTCPDGWALIKLLMSGQSQSELARKYNCSPQNINQKIQRVTRLEDPEFLNQYLKDSVPILKSIEANHLNESIQPDRIAKMSSYQLTGMAKLIWEMRRTEEGKSTEIHENRDLIVSLQSNIERFLEADKAAEIDVTPTNTVKDIDTPEE